MSNEVEDYAFELCARYATADETRRLQEIVEASRPTPSAGNDVTEDAEWLRDLAVRLSDEGDLHSANCLERIADRLSAARPLGDDALEPPRWGSATPMIRRGENWTKVHLNEDGTLGADITADEAEAIGAWQFHLLKPGSAAATAALSTASTREKGHG